jgi:hypothetical protein
VNTSHYAFQEPGGHQVHGARTSLSLYCTGSNAVLVCTLAVVSGALDAVRFQAQCLTTVAARGKAKLEPSVAMKGALSRLDQQAHKAMPRNPLLYALTSK